jgi:hypothetical protein
MAALLLQDSKHRLNQSFAPRISDSHSGTGANVPAVCLSPGVRRYWRTFISGAGAPPASSRAANELGTYTSPRVARTFGLDCWRSRRSCAFTHNLVSETSLWRLVTVCFHLVENQGIGLVRDSSGQVI